MGGGFLVIAPAVRETALSELRGVWMTLCRNYVQETLDRDRIPFDCPFCGVHVSRDGVTDDDRCLCVLAVNDGGTDWL